MQTYIVVMVRQLRYITKRRKAVLRNSPIHRKLKVLDRPLLFNGKGSVDGGFGRRWGLAAGGSGKRDVLRNVSNRRARKAVLAKRKCSVQLAEAAFTGL